MCHCSSLQGPPNPDVFAAPPEGDTSAQMSEEVLKESKVIQDEIQNLLNEVKNLKKGEYWIVELIFSVL